MAWPMTVSELRAAGYTYDNEAKCRGCGDSIEWWITPNGKKMPMSIIRVPLKEFNSYEEKRQAHFADCEEVKMFRQKRYER